MNTKLPVFVLLLHFWLNAMGAFSQKYRRSAPATPMRPNSILIMSDDQGWGDVSYNGHPYLKTPNLDQMTRDGARFTRGYSSFLLEGQTAHIGTRYKIYREKTVAEWQMFDLLADPNETKNIAPQKSDLFGQLIAEWSDWEKSGKNSAAGKDY